LPLSRKVFSVIQLLVVETRMGMDILIWQLDIIRAS
jgi:hypothetical protein